MEPIQEHILAYLRQPSDAGAIRQLIEDGEAAFDRILRYSGPYPDGMFPLDCWDDLLIPMLGRIGSARPDILSRHLAAPAPDRLTTLILAAVSSRDPRFADLLVRHLNSRSYAAIDLILDAMQQHEYLQTVSAIPRLAKLLAGKQVRHLMNKRDRIETLLAKIQLKETPGRPLDPIRHPCPCGAGWYVRNRRYDDGGGNWRDAGIAEEWRMECPACAKTYVDTMRNDFAPYPRRWVRRADLRRHEKVWAAYMDRLGALIAHARATYLSRWRHSFDHRATVEVWQVLYKAGLLEGIARGTLCRFAGLTSWPAFAKAVRLSGMPHLLAKLFEAEQFPVIFRLMGVRDLHLEALMAQEQEFRARSRDALEVMKRHSSYPPSYPVEDSEPGPAWLSKVVPFVPGATFADGSRGWMELGVPPGALQIPDADDPLFRTPAKRQNPERIPAWVWDQFASVADFNTVVFWRDDQVKWSGILQGERSLFWNHRTNTEGAVTWRLPGSGAPGQVELQVRPRASAGRWLVLLGVPRYEQEAVRWLRQKTDLMRQVFPAGVWFEEKGEDAR